MKTSKILLPVLTIILFGFSLSFAAGKEGASQDKGYVSIDNLKTGLTWRFYPDSGNRRLPHGFCQKKENDGGPIWRMPVRKEFESLIADPTFELPAGLATKYFSYDIRNAFGHKSTPEEIDRWEQVYKENSDALVFDLAKKKWKWEWVTDEFNVACVAPMK